MNAWLQRRILACPVRLSPIRALIAAEDPSSNRQMFWYAYLYIRRSLLPCLHAIRHAGMRHEIQFREKIGAGAQQVRNMQRTKPNNQNVQTVNRTCV